MILIPFERSPYKMTVQPARKLGNQALCRGTHCKLENNIMPRGSVAIPVSVKGNDVFMCPTCALMLAEDIKDTATAVLTAHEVARAHLKR